MSPPPVNVVLLVLVTFVIVNVVLLVRSVARSGRIQHAAPRTEPPMEPLPGQPTAQLAAPPTDPLAALDDVASWGRRITGEAGQGRPYPRPVTIVRIELDGLAALDSALGEPAGDRLVGATADALRQLASGRAHIARMGRSGFGVLMPETPADAATGYVQRVVRALEHELPSGTDAVRPVIGWATTSGDLDLVDVELAAMRRMRAGTGRARPATALLASVR